MRLKIYKLTTHQTAATATDLTISVSVQRVMFKCLVLRGSDEVVTIV